MENDGGAVATPRSINKRGGDVAQKRDGPNWKRIKAEYVRGGISQQKLADKYGVPFGTLHRRCLLEKWSQLKKAAALKADQKLTEKTADIQADTAARLMKLQSEAALAIYEKLVANIANYPEGIGTKTMRETVDVKKVTVNGEAREIPLKSAFVNDLEALVRSMTQLARLYGIDTASRHAAERLEMQKQQGGTSDNTEAFNANMVSIAELINHPMPDRTIADIETDGEGKAGGEEDGDDNG